MLDYFLGSDLTDISSDDADWQGVAGPGFDSDPPSDGIRHTDISNSQSTHEDGPQNDSNPPSDDNGHTNISDSSPNHEDDSPQKKAHFTLVPLPHDHLLQGVDCLAQDHMGGPTFSTDRGSIYSFELPHSSNDALPPITELLTQYDNSRSIIEWSQAYRNTVLPPGRTPPIHKSDKFEDNTTRYKLPFEVEQTFIRIKQWNLTLSQIKAQYPVLDHPFNFELDGLDARFKPQPDTIITQAITSEQEAELALARTFWPNVECVTRYIALLKFRGVRLTPPDDDPANEQEVLFPWAGNSAYGMSQQAGSAMPDRCGLPSDFRKNTYARLVGDVKVSFKFRACWMTLVPYKAYRSTKYSNETFEGKADAQSQRVARQIRFYMTRPAAYTTDQSISITNKYGYIITDQEVMLVKREKGILYATQGFPLWAPSPPSEISGMTAMIYAHLVAGSKDGLIHAVKPAVQFDEELNEDRKTPPPEREGPALQDGQTPPADHHHPPDTKPVESDDDVDMYLSDHSKTSALIVNSDDTAMSTQPSDPRDATYHGSQEGSGDSDEHRSEAEEGDDHDDDDDEDMEDVEGEDSDERREDDDDDDDDDDSGEGEEDVV